MGIGRRRRVSLRETWPHGAPDFTIWLRDSVGVLSGTTEVELTGAEGEQAAGDMEA